jgi:hypothetical protein
MANQPRPFNPNRPFGGQPIHEALVAGWRRSPLYRLARGAEAASGQPPTPKPILRLSSGLALAIFLCSIDGKYPNTDVRGILNPPEFNETRCLPRCHRDGANESELVWRIRGWKHQSGDIANIGKWRLESVAILRALGDGDVFAAAGRELLITGWISGNLTTPKKARGTLCRIENVSRARNRLGNEAYDAHVAVLENATASNCTCMHEASDPPLRVLLTWVFFTLRFLWAYFVQMPAIVFVFSVPYNIYVTQRQPGSRLARLVKTLTTWTSLSFISF